MRNSLLLLLLGLYACTGNNEKDMVGIWIEQMPQGMNYLQGFHLKDNGTAESVGMRTLLYNKWEIKDNKLILSGESVGNGQTIQFSDTMNIIRCHADTLVVNRKNMDVVNGEMSTDELFTLKGTVTIGHEVRAFNPEGSSDEYWIVDKTGSLEDLYDKTTKGQKNGSPVKAVLKLEYNGKWDDGFAAEYSGVFFVREVVSLNK